MLLSKVLVWVIKVSGIFPHIILHMEFFFVIVGTPLPSPKRRLGKILWDLYVLSSVEFTARSCNMDDIQKAGLTIWGPYQRKAGAPVLSYSPLPTKPLPSPSIAFPPLPFIPVPTLSLEVGPLNPARDLRSSVSSPSGVWARAPVKSIFFDNETMLAKITQHLFFNNTFKHLAHNGR